MNHFAGLMAAPFTPFDSRGNVNPEAIPGYVEKLVTDGVKGIFVCGSNGEGPNMTIEERMLTAEAFCRAAASRLKVFVHVGHSSIRESQKLAEHAGKIGADALSSVSAFYFKPSGIKDLMSALADIASAAPDLPFYYYHIPHLTGVNMDMREVLEEGDKKIRRFAGVKYTASTVWEYQLAREYGNYKFDLLFGMDEMMLPALSVGAKGFIGSTYNFAAPLYCEVVRHFENGQLEKAREKMLYLVQMVSIILKFPPIAAQKTIMKRLGLDLGPSRLPLPAFTDAQEADLLKRLDSISFFEKLLSVPTTSNGG